MSGKLYDVVVVGSGPAGYASAIQAVRSGLKTLVLQGFEAGGRLMLTGEVESYPGVAEGITGPELSERMEEQSADYGAELYPDNAVRGNLVRWPFRLWAEGEDDSVFARAVIVATGPDLAGSGGGRTAAHRAGRERRMRRVRRTPLLASPVLPGFLNEATYDSESRWPQGFTLDTHGAR